MKLVKQRGNADCLFACICSLLEIDINTTPVIEFGMEDDDFWIEFNSWTYSLGYGTCSFKKFPFIPKESIVIAIGESPYQSGLKHAVLWQHGQLLFDPSKNGDKGIIGKPEEFVLLMKLFK